MLRCAFLTIAAILLASSPGQAVDRKPETDAAFNRYVQLSEQSMQNDLQSGPFLWVDELPTQQREAVSARLKRGEVATRRLETLERGASIPVPGGLIHHWVGVVFIPGANLTQTLALLQGYDEHSRIYAPRVLRSKLIQHNGDDFMVFSSPARDEDCDCGSGHGIRCALRPPGLDTRLQPVVQHPSGRSGRRRTAGRARKTDRGRQRFPLATQFLLALLGARWRRVRPTGSYLAHPRHPRRAWLAHSSIRHQPTE